MQSVQPVAVSIDPQIAPMNKFRSYVTTLGDPNCKDAVKLKAAQEISKNFEWIIASTHYPMFLKHSVRIFLNVLQEGERHFIAEYNIQQVRKLILEMLYRLPTNEALRPYVIDILSLMFRLLEIDNEENVLVCLKIIIELHKQYKPTFNNEIQNFLCFGKRIYSDLPNHMDRIFQRRVPIRVKDLSEVNIEELLKETYTMTPIQTEKRNKDGTVIQFYLIPKAVMSLKVLQELPIIVVLMYQLYKNSVHQDVSDFIPLIMNTIILQPTLEQRQAEGFNKEIFVDFMGAQVKTLSFLAYIIKIYQDIVLEHSAMLVQGMLSLLTLCPMEVANLRRELLIAARHILATELRNKFVPHIEKLFDEDILLGRGWTTYESLRPLAYSTLADLVHHVRQQLPLSELARAVHLFSKNAHDESLVPTIQTMSCKLLLNLVDCIRLRSEMEGSTQGRELLIRMLEVFVLKFKTIAKIQLPEMVTKFKQQQQEFQNNPQYNQPNNQSQPNSEVDPKLDTDAKPSASEILEAMASLNIQREERSKIGFPQSIIYIVADYRSLVKTLVCGVKTITWGCSQCKVAGHIVLPPKHFLPHETLVFVRLVKWALKALDIYTLSPQPTAAQKTNQPNVRSKEEKEVLEHFSGVFSMMSPQTFYQVFSTTIEYLVERVHKNPTLQIVPNTLLANPATSPIFATVLVEYLLERMEEMGSNIERSNLYLRLFKLVFGSVSLFPQENENMLRPHLHQIVNRSMELAMVAKEPYNYFLLLRALFRSIGGGSHDLLYQEFLPLLPTLLEGLNRLQSGLHKQQMKDLFVELCLTVPVRLSSLLPYLPLLMDPLISALNGTQVLISQGLRTLELCVDNLQHDFFYDHIHPVRSDLMQALWRIARSKDPAAPVAFKVLGKFGGGNRKMMHEPQKLEYVCDHSRVPCIVTHFKKEDAIAEFAIDKVLESAYNALKQSNTDTFYRKHAWEVIHCCLVASRCLEDDQDTLIKLFFHPSLKDPSTVPQVEGGSYKCVNKKLRETHQTALAGMFMAAANKELQSTVLPVMVGVVRHYTMVAIAQQSGLFAFSPEPPGQVALDPLVIVDTLAFVMGHEEKELCKAGQIGLMLMIDTAVALLGSREMACKLPLIQYLSERMCALCYERAWYAKLGGCVAIRFMFDRFAPVWVYNHIFTFLKAMFYVMMDLTGEVSSGALDMAKDNLEKMLTVCVTPLSPNSDDDTRKAQQNALQEVTHELVRQVTSPHAIVNEQAMNSLRLLAKKQDKTVSSVMEPFKKVLAEIVPPKKHLLKDQPAIAQIGIMDGNTFCTTLNPRLFTIDMSIKEHSLFITDLLSICNTEDSKLSNFSCYKSVTDFTPLRTSALRCLAACYYIEEVQEQLFEVLYKALEKPNPKLQETAFKCMQQFLAGYQVEKELVHQTVRPLLITLGDVKSLTLNNLQLLSYLTQLFPLIFNEKLCDQLIEILKQLLDNLITLRQASETSASTTLDEEQKIVTVIGIFRQTPAATPKFISLLCQVVIVKEQLMLIEPSSPFREVLMKFLLRYPQETMEMFLSDGYIKDKQYSRYLEYLIKHNDGRPFREHIENNMVTRLITMALSNTHISYTLTQSDQYELQYQSIRIISILIKNDEQWLSTQQELVEALKQIWCNDAYQERHKNVDSLDYTHWREPKLIVKVLLHYFCHHPNDIDLLFQLLRAFCYRFIPIFQFLQNFLEKTVAQDYTVDWKRSAFFRFVELFYDNVMSQELKSKVIMLILIPSFAVSFERGETNRLIGSLPSPYQDSNDNIVSVFINRLIDPDSQVQFEDCIRIALLQFSCLLVDQASQHIHDHDASNKTGGGFKLRRLMTFAWPCLLVENCIDPATRYHGHLLLSHIINKFAINRKIILQVFHSLLKAHGVEARNVVRQALDILTPAMPLRMEEGNQMLVHWTKKIIVDEGHSMQQLFHILQLVVRHYKVYYPVRHHLVPHMARAIHRLGFSPTATVEYRKLAVDLAEVIITWDLFGIEEVDNSELTKPSLDEPSRKRLAVQSQPSTSSAQPVPVPMEIKPNKTIDNSHIDAVLNFLLRLACQVTDPSAAQNQTNLSEILSRRCVLLLKSTLKPDLWSPPLDIKPNIFERTLLTITQANPNLTNIFTALELLTFLLGVLKKDQIISNFKELQKGLVACIQTTNTKVVRAVHGLLTKLMSIFPAENINSAVACKHQELQPLYATIGKVILDGLTNYENNAQTNSSTIFGPVILLNGACAGNPLYIDPILTLFTKVLIKLVNIEHLQPPASADLTPLISELIILGLDLLKTKTKVMDSSMKREFMGSILMNLIEKSSDSKVMKAICKMLEEWMRNKNDVNQEPSLKENSMLLVAMMENLEKRFQDDTELNSQFLELIHSIYIDDEFKNIDLYSKLEPAFLAGLRSTQPHIRAKFIDAFKKIMNKHLNLLNCLLYVAASQHWEGMVAHYWIKQCIDLLLTAATTDMKIKLSDESCHLPSITSIVNNADPKKKQELYEMPQSMDSYESVEVKEDVLDIGNPDDPVVEEKQPLNRTVTLIKLMKLHYEFIEKSRDVTLDTFLTSVVQLCHMDNKLSEEVWLQFFPNVWRILSGRDKGVLIKELVPFVFNSIHKVPHGTQPTPVNTFVEALYRCDPKTRATVPVLLTKYLARCHNLWYRMVLELEESYYSGTVNTSAYVRSLGLEDPDKTDLRNTLSDIYQTLCEDDLWASVWQKHAHYKETVLSVSYEQHGYFELALEQYENAAATYKVESKVEPASVFKQAEVKMWSEHWLRCSKELNKWDSILEIGKYKKDQHFIVESSWRLHKFDELKKALPLVLYVSPEEMNWKLTLYDGYIMICMPDENNKSPKLIEQVTDSAINHCLSEWRRLPHIVSHVHLQYLQAAQQIVEFQDAYQIQKSVLLGPQNSLHDLKATLKTWRCRLPLVSDDLSHWNAISTWRQPFYKTIIEHYEAARDPPQFATIMGPHGSAQCLINFAKVARKHRLTQVCNELLRDIYNISSVPVMDCFQKIRQQVKCHLLQACQVTHKNDLSSALEVINTTNVKYFTKEMMADLYSMKGMMHYLLGNTDEAYKSLSAAVQVDGNSLRSWAIFGEYVESIFLGDPVNRSDCGPKALICYLHACRHTNEPKARKILAKVLWLLSYEDDKGSFTKALDEYAGGISPALWLPWIPQLINYLTHHEGKVIQTILSQIGRIFPQAVYYPVRILYLTLRSATARKTTVAQHIPQDSKGESSSQSVHQENPINAAGPNIDTAAVVASTIKATPAMLRCITIMKLQREINPTVIASLESIADQMEWFKESWYEEVLRQLRQGLAKCYAIAFENRDIVNQVTIPPHILSFVKKVISTFGLGLEHFSNSSNLTFNSAASESLARRAEETSKDPVFNEMKQEFVKDFDFSQAESMKLHKIIFKLRKWIKILDNRSKMLLQSFLIEEKCRFLSNFTLKTAEVELPGEFLMPKHNNYYVKITRFMPRVDIVQKLNAACRRLYIRGHNGRIYPYLVVNDSGVHEFKREQRVLQLLRMLNYCLRRQKETARRFLHYTVPKAVAVSQQIRLVEDNPASLSLLDIYKEQCSTRLNIDHEKPIQLYYVKLAVLQSRGLDATHQSYRDILKEVQSTIVPKTLLKQWAVMTFVSPTDYFHFRKTFISQLALACFTEYVFHLTRLNPDMMYIHKDSGLMNVSYFKFDLNDANGEFNPTRPVLFRLTPNIAEFVTPLGISGPLTASMIAIARCLVYPNFKVTAILKPILKDEVQLQRISKAGDIPSGGYENFGNSEYNISLVNKAVTSITNRLYNVTHLDGVENKAATYATAASSPDNLCRMDPAWHPWL